MDEEAHYLVCPALLAAVATAVGAAPGRPIPLTPRARLLLGPAEPCRRDALCLRVALETYVECKKHRKDDLLGASPVEIQNILSRAARGVAAHAAA